LKNKIKAKIVKYLLQRDYKNEIDISEVKRVLIIRNSGVGDAICMEPMLREFKRNFPNIELDLFASLGNKIIFEHIKYVDNIFVKHRKRQIFKRIFEFVKMKNRKYDLLIDTTKYHFDKALMSYFLNPKWAIATEVIDKNIVDRKKLSFYVRLLPVLKSEHIVDKLQRFLVLLGMEIQDNNICLEVPLQSKIRAKKFMEKIRERRIVGINSDAKDINRTLSKEQVLVLCKKLLSDGYVVLLFAIGKNRDVFKGMIEKEHMSNVYLIYETPNIYDAIALIEFLDVIISPDTAYVHIASALDIPTVGLFWNNMQRITEWGPKAKNSVVITSNIDADNSLENLDLNKVVKEVKNIVSKSGVYEK
jgi:ADP-heptose:LPS heptosyltransferase